VLGELCRMYTQGGRISDAREMDAQLQALDPLSPISHSQSFVVDLLAGVSEHTLEATIQFLRTAPEFAFHRLLCALSLIHLGRLNEAPTIVEEAHEERLPSIAGRQCAFIRHALSGNRDAALSS